MARITVVWLIAFTLFAFGSVFAGAAYLEWSLPGGLPFGNALTAAGFSSAGGAAFIASNSGSFLRRFSEITLILAITWLPISIWLAGNLSLNFNGVNGSLWVGLSLLTFVFSLISMIWAIVRAMSNKDARGRPTGVA